ncbi:unnamed protein product, partial [Oppiella nova]
PAIFAWEIRDLLRRELVTYNQNRNQNESTSGTSSSAGESDLNEWHECSLRLDPQFKHIFCSRIQTNE